MEVLVKKEKGQVVHKTTLVDGKLAETTVCNKSTEDMLESPLMPPSRPCKKCFK